MVSGTHLANTCVLVDCLPLLDASDAFQSATSSTTSYCLHPAVLTYSHFPPLIKHPVLANPPSPSQKSPTNLPKFLNMPFHVSFSLVGSFNPFTFKVIIDKYDAVAIYFIVLGSSLYTLFVFPV